jgi:DDE family transposase
MPSAATRRSRPRSSKHGADYLIALKGNQASLLKDVELYFADPLSPAEIFSKTDKGHGRIVTRVLRCATDIAFLKDGLPDLAMIACIETTTEKPNAEPAHEKRYYVSSRVMAPARLALAIRSHWAIENSLHWLGARRHLQGRSFPRPPRQRRPQHGRRPPLRPEPRPPRQRPEAKHQARPQKVRLVNRLPQIHPAR